MATYNKLIDLEQLGVYNTKILELLAELTGAMQDEVNSATAQQVINPRDFTSAEHWGTFGPPFGTIAAESGLIKYTQRVVNDSCGISVATNPFSCSNSSPALIKIQLGDIGGEVTFSLSTYSDESMLAKDVISKHSNSYAGGTTQPNEWTSKSEISSGFDGTILALVDDSRDVSRLRIHMSGLSANSPIYIKSATIYRNAAQMAEVLGLYD